MSREELREIITLIIKKIQDVEAPRPACLWTDNTCDTYPCDVSTRYAIGEEG